MGKYNRILLLGFRCVGKTTISKKLSKIMGIPSIDVDEEIEKEQRKTITKITNNGLNWKNFREIELLKLKEILKINNIIISAGGGVGVNDVKYNDNLTYGDLQRDVIIKSADTLKILLFVDEDVLKNRLFLSKINGNNRPDLKDKSANIDEYIENNIKIMRQREKYYNKMADIAFNTNNENIEKNTINLIKIINNL